jgi:hypothetical protein
VRRPPMKWSAIDESLRNTNIFNDIFRCNLQGISATYVVTFLRLFSYCYLSHLFVFSVIQVRCFCVKITKCLREKLKAM